MTRRTLLAGFLALPLVARTRAALQLRRPEPHWSLAIGLDAPAGVAIHVFDGQGAVLASGTYIGRGTYTLTVRGLSLVCDVFKVGDSGVVLIDRSDRRQESLIR